MVANPYSQENLSFNTFVRTFERDVNNEELVWHSDEFDRIVTVMNDCQGWLLQLDNEIPKYLHKGDIVEIERDRYHRLIKFDFDKTSELIVKIQENICVEE